MLKTSFNSRSKRFDQSDVSSATRTSSALTRSLPFDRTTDPSTTKFARSCLPASRTLRGLFLNMNDDVSDLTSSPSIAERLRTISLVRPSAKKSLSVSTLRFLNGRTTIGESVDARPQSKRPDACRRLSATPHRRVSPFPAGRARRSAPSIVRRNEPTRARRRARPDCAYRSAVRIDRAVDDAHERAREDLAPPRQGASAYRSREPREAPSTIPRAPDTCPSRGDREARRDCRRRSEASPPGLRALPAQRRAEYPPGRAPSRRSSRAARSRRRNRSAPDAHRGRTTRSGP